MGQGEELTMHGYSRSLRFFPKDFLPPRETSLNLVAHCVDMFSTRGGRDGTLRGLAHCALAMSCIAGERPRRYAAVYANSWDR